MDDAVAGVLLVEGADLVSVGPQPGHEGIPSLRVLHEEVGEVGGEALAQPDVVPVALRDRVAEPLVGDLVHDHAVPPPRGPTHGVVAVEDRRRRLHPSLDAVRLDVGEPLVGVGADAGREEVEGRDRRLGEGLEALVPVLRKDPGLDGQAPPGRAVLHREACHPELVEPRRDGDRLPPVREAPAVAEVGLLDEEPVRDDLVVGRGGDPELARGLVVRVIDDGQPLPGLVRPVVGEERPVAVLVRGDEEAVGRRAVIADDDLPPLAVAVPGARARRAAGPARARTAAGPRLAVTPVTVMPRPPGAGDGCARSRTISQTPRLEDAEADRGLALDRVGVVGQRQAERVVEDVDPRLARVRVRPRGARRRHREQERRRAPHVSASRPAARRSPPR